MPFLPPNQHSNSVKALKAPTTYKFRLQLALKTFICLKYTVDIDRIQMRTKDKKNTNTQYVLYYNVAVARFLTTTRRRRCALYRKFLRLLTITPPTLLRTACILCGRCSASFRVVVLKHRSLQFFRNFTRGELICPRNVQ